MPDRWINWPLLLNPANWIVVWLSIMFLVILITVLHATWTNLQGTN